MKLTVLYQEIGHVILVLNMNAIAHAHVIGP